MFTDPVERNLTDETAAAAAPPVEQLHTKQKTPERGAFISQSDAVFIFLIIVIQRWANLSTGGATMGL